MYASESKSSTEPATVAVRVTTVVTIEDGGAGGHDGDRGGDGRGEEAGELGCEDEDGLNVGKGSGNEGSGGEGDDDGGEGGGGEGGGVPGGWLSTLAVMCECLATMGYCTMHSSYVPAVSVTVTCKLASSCV